MKYNTLITWTKNFIDYQFSLRARLQGKSVPLGDRGTLPTRVEDTVVLHAKFEHGMGTLPRSVKR